MAVCPPTLIGFYDWQDDFDAYFNTAYLIFSILIGIAMITFTVYFFTKRKPEERPCFVVIWIILMHVFWVLNAVFFVQIMFVKENKHSWTNFGRDFESATADFAMSLADWILIEQLLYACFMTPTIIDAFYNPLDNLEARTK